MKFINHNQMNKQNKKENNNGRNRRFFDNTELIHNFNLAFTMKF